MRYARIKDYMTKQPYVITPDQPLDEAWDHMQSLGIRHFPVVENDRLSGIVSARDIRIAMASDMTNALTIGDIMSTDVYVSHPDERLSDIAKDMAEEKIGSAVILNNTRHVIGIFTTTDALKLLSDYVDEGFETLGEDDEIEHFNEGWSAIF